MEGAGRLGGGHTHVLFVYSLLVWRLFTPGLVLKPSRSELADKVALVTQWRTSLSICAVFPPLTRCGRRAAH